MPDRDLPNPWRGRSGADICKGCAVEQSPAPRPEQPVILSSKTPGLPALIRGFLLKPRWFQISYCGRRGLRARRRSRLRQLSVHAGRPRLQDVLSAGASSIPPGAFGLVPPRHDDTPRISVLRPPIRMQSSILATAAGQCSFTPRPEGFPAVRASAPTRGG
jgi:hypothetical protein